MRVLIHPRAITADEGLRARVAAALEAALAPVRRHLLWVDAYLTDVNGPRGGPDKRCRVVAHLRTGPVVVSRTGVDPVAALAAAAPAELETLIHSTGFFRAKARNLLGMARTLVAEHGGEVPADLDALTALCDGVTTRSA